MGSDEASDCQVASARPSLSPVSSESALASSPEARARCGSSARRDLCGGCGETRIPTATIPCRRSRVRVSSAPPETKRGSEQSDPLIYFEESAAASIPSPFDAWQALISPFPLFLPELLGDQLHPVQLVPGILSSGDMIVNSCTCPEFLLRVSLWREWQE